MEDSREDSHFPFFPLPSKGSLLQPRESRLASQLRAAVRVGAAQKTFGCNPQSLRARGGQRRAWGPFVHGSDPGRALLRWFFFSLPHENSNSQAHFFALLHASLDSLDRIVTEPSSSATLPPAWPVGCVTFLRGDRPGRFHLRRPDDLFWRRGRRDRRRQDHRGRDPWPP